MRTTIYDELAAIRATLTGLADPAHKAGAKRYFKETIEPLGVRSADMNRTVAATWRRVRNWDKSLLWSLCGALWNTGVFEEGSLACKLAARVRDAAPEDFEIFADWLARHVCNWAHCDDLCSHALGTLVRDHPALFGRLAEWVRSDNRWMRRGACVAMLPGLKTENPAPATHNLERAFQLADHLLEDHDDLVQKGYGWMLKEAGARFPDEVFGFLMAHRDRMGRTGFRYALEKLPPDLRGRAMGKTD